MKVHVIKVAGAHKHDVGFKLLSAWSGAALLTTFSQNYALGVQSSP